MLFFIEKYKDLFQGGVCLGWISTGGNFAWGGKFLGEGIKFPAEMLHWGDLTEHLHGILFNCLAFFLLDFSYGYVPG